MIALRVPQGRKVIKYNTISSKPLQRRKSLVQSTNDQRLSEIDFGFPNLRKGILWELSKPYQYVLLVLNSLDRVLCLVCYRLSCDRLKYQPWHVIKELYSPPPPILY